MIQRRYGTQNQSRLHVFENTCSNKTGSTQEYSKCSLCVLGMAIKINWKLTVKKINFENLFLKNDHSFQK